MIEGEALYRAEKAREIIDNPLFAESLALIEADLVEEALDARNDGGVLSAIDKLRALRSVSETLRSVIVTGQAIAKRNKNVAP